MKTKRLVKKFISYYAPYKKPFTIDMLCAVIISAIDLAFPQILTFLTGNIYTRPRRELYWSLAIVAVTLGAMYVVRYFCQYYVTAQGHIMGVRMENDMRKQFFEHYCDMPFSYFDRNTTGEMISRLTTDLFDVSELAHHGPETLLLAAIKITGSFILLAAINWQMSLILLAVTAIMLVYCSRQNILMRSAFRENRKAMAEINCRIQDSLTGIRVVKSFANEGEERKKFENINVKFFQTKSASYELMGRYQALSSTMQGMLYICILVSGGFFVSSGSITVTDLALFAIYIGIFLSPINLLINFAESFQKGMTSFARFVEIVDLDTEKERPDAVELANVQGEVRFNDVSFSYVAEKPVLQHLSLTIQPGESVAFVGPSGEGKTTICSLIPRFYDVCEGSITVDGQDIRDLTLHSLRSNIGIVQQDVFIFNGTIRENIAYGDPTATDEDIIRAAKMANIHDFITELSEGYDSYVGERGVMLSGGQKQRISIARAFLKDPPILILDEATSSLDNESEKLIQHSLEALKQGRTTIIIAHRLSTIRDVDRIFVIDEHRIVEEGTHTELLEAHGLYSTYYNA